ncbi:hypothetical protein PMAYCL1PPCAC_25702, partial [Pristionchus mayeri]
FNEMFFGDSSERGQEIEIKDVIYEEFMYFLQLIYSLLASLTDDNVIYILKLSDRFHAEDLMKACENYLIQSTGIDDNVKKLMVDKYRLFELKRSLMSISDLDSQAHLQTASHSFSMEYETEQETQMDL